MGQMAERRTFKGWILATYPKVQSKQNFKKGLNKAWGSNGLETNKNQFCNKKKLQPTQKCSEKVRLGSWW